MLKKIKIFSLILFFLVFASLSLYFRTLDYLQGIVLIYSFYAIFLFLIPVFSKRKIINLKNNYFPFVSILIPARNEINVISSTIHSMASIDYHKNNNPNFEIIVVDDSSTDGTNLILQSLKKQLSNLEVIIRTPENGGKGKASALNEGLKYCKGEIIAVFDADTRISSDYLKNIVPYLANKKIGGAQGKIRIYNSRKNFITKFQEDEFCLINHLIQIARDSIGGITFLAGNGQITKKKALLEVGGWNENSVTEDFDLTLRLTLKKWKIKYCSNAVIWQEGIEKLLPLLRQRIRWASGLLSSFSDYFFSFIFQPLKTMMKLDALITLLRITIPFYIIFGYLLLLISLFFKWRFYFIIPEKSFLFISLIFFLAMFLAIYRESPKFNLLRIKGKILRYWLFSFIWLLAVPIAFFNSFKNKNSIFFWDKTFHKGDFSLPLIKKEEIYNFSSRKNLINLQKDVLFK